MSNFSLGHSTLEASYLKQTPGSWQSKATANHRPLEVYKLEMCVSKSLTYLLHLAHFFTGLLLLIEVSLLSNDILIKAEICKTEMLHEKPMGTETISTWVQILCYLLCGLVYWIYMCLHIYLPPSSIQLSTPWTD